MGRRQRSLVRSVGRTIERTIERTVALSLVLSSLLCCDGEDATSSPEDSSTLPRSVEAGTALGHARLDGAVDEDAHDAPRGMDATMPAADAGLTPRPDAARPLRDAGPNLTRPGFVRRSDVINYVHWSGSGPPPCYLSTSQNCSARLFTAGVAVRDYDADGWPDVYATRMDDPDLLLRNNGDGTFTDVRELVGIDVVYLSNGAAWGDIDDDGDADLMVGTVGEDRLHLFVQADGHFEEQAHARGASLADGQEHTTMSLCFGDTDLDGLLDLATTEWRGGLASDASSHNRLLRNDPLHPGHFTDVTYTSGIRVDHLKALGAYGFTMQIVDLDGDGPPELLFASDFGTSRLFWNEGNGTFLDGTRSSGVGTEENAMGSAVGDYDGDGRMDWLVSSILSPMGCPQAGCTWGVTGNRLYHGAGARRFEDHTSSAGVRDGGWAWGTAFFDFDHDGDLDIVMANGIDYLGLRTPFSRDALRLWRNDGNGRFQEVAATVGMVDDELGRGVAPFDYDNDGDLDLLVTNFQGRPSFYENRATEGRSWLVVRPRGTTSNSDGTGAVVRLWATPAGPMQLRHAGNGCGFLAHTPGEPHFGLGDVEVVHRIEVTFPATGRSVVLEDVPARQHLEVVEPAS